jgi:hypothetical protein
MTEQHRIGYRVVPIDSLEDRVTDLFWGKSELISFSVSIYACLTYKQNRHETEVKPTDNRLLATGIRSCYRIPVIG